MSLEIAVTYFFIGGSFVSAFISFKSLEYMKALDDREILKKEEERDQSASKIYSFYHTIFLLLTVVLLLTGGYITFLLIGANNVGNVYDGVINLFARVVFVPITLILAPLGFYFMALYTSVIWGSVSRWLKKSGKR